MFDIPKPTIKTTLSYKENNFTFIVYAHRKLTQNEMIFWVKEIFTPQKTKKHPQIQQSKNTPTDMSLKIFYKKFYIFFSIEY